MNVKPTSKNILQQFSSVDNRSIIFDSVVDIFNKKSNFNAERIIGRKQLSNIITDQMKNVISAFLKKIIESKKNFIECITILNKYTIQNTVILVSKSNEYKTFIQSISKPTLDTSIIIPKPKEDMVKPQIISNYKPEHTIQERMEYHKQIRSQENKIPSVDFKIQTNEQKINDNNVDDILSRYTKERMESDVVDKKENIDIIEEDELSLDFLQQALFGETEEHQKHEDNQNRHEQQEEYQYEDQNQREHQKEIEVIVDTIDATVKNLNLIKEYFLYVANK